MAVPPHNRVVIEGAYGDAAAPAETFSFSLNTEPSPFQSDTHGVLVANQILSSAQEFFKPHYSNGVAFMKATIWQVGADGKVLRDEDGQYRKYESTIPGEAGTLGAGVNYPPSVALAVSLGTTRSGPTGKGRFFLPAPGYAVDILTWTIPADKALDIAQDAASLVSIINGETGNVVVASSKGVLSRVTNVRVGRALDTMRSRRRDLPESYSPPQPI